MGKSASLFINSIISFIVTITALRKKVFFFRPVLDSSKKAEGPSSVVLKKIVIRFLKKFKKVVCVEKNLFLSVYER